MVQLFNHLFYLTRIVEKNNKNNIFYKVDATNPLTKDDINNKLSYTLINTNPIFGINNNGEIFTTNDLVVNYIKKPFNNLINIQVSNTAGNIATIQVVVDMVEVNQSPLFQSIQYNFSINENIPLNTLIGQVNAQDTDSGIWGRIIYSITSLSNINYDFVINSTSGEIKTTSYIDYENINQYEFIITAKDGGGQFHMTNLLINVLNINEPPYDLQLSNNKLNENQKIKTNIGTLTAKDPEDNVFTYKIVNNNDFIIINNTLYSNKIFNYESDSTFNNVIIRVSDPSGLYFDKSFIIEIVDVNEPPTNIRLLQTSFEEDSKVNTILTDVMYDEPDINDIVRCSIIEKSPFVISNNRFVLISELDYERVKEYNLTISCIDSGSLIGTNYILINIIDVIDQVKYISVNFDNVLENTSNNTYLGKISAVNPDNDAKNITFISNNNNYIITDTVCKNNTNFIQGYTTGIVCYANIFTNGIIDYESNNNNLEITTITDKNRIKNNIIPINVVNINESPIGISWERQGQIVEYSDIGTIVGFLNIIDPDIDNNFEMWINTDIFEVFKIDDNRFKIFLSKPESIRYDTNKQINFDVIVSDGEFTKTFNTFVNVINAPIILSINEYNNNIITVSENTSVNSIIGILIVSNVDIDTPYPKLYINNDFINLDGTNFILTRQLTYNKNNNVYDFIIISDSNEKIVEHKFKLIVKEANKPPIFNLLQKYLLIDTDVNVGTTVASPYKNQLFNVADPDGDKIIFSLPYGNDILKIDPDTGRLYIKNTPSSLNLIKEDYTLTIGIYDTVNYITKNITYKIIDQCYSNPCGNNNCKPTYKSYLCDCGNNNYQQNCNLILLQAASVNSNNMASASLIGIIIGCIVLVIILVGLVVVIRRRNINTVKTDENIENAMSNPLFFNPNILQNKSINGLSNPSYSFNQIDSEYSYANNINFTDGFSNPFYSWYKPDFSRKESELFLNTQDNGSFVVRESKATPGWHIFTYKNSDGIYHEKIKCNEDYMYELVVPNSQQPQFDNLPSLVHYYVGSTSTISESIYNSVDSQPIYDNNNIKNNFTNKLSNPIYYIPDDPNAPPLPPKERYSRA